MALWPFGQAMRTRLPSSSALRATFDEADVDPDLSRLRNVISDQAAFERHIGLIVERRRQASDRPRSRGLEHEHSVSRALDCLANSVQRDSHSYEAALVAVGLDSSEVVGKSLPLKVVDPGARGSEVCSSLDLPRRPMQLVFRGIRPSLCHPLEGERGG